jgi:glycosyltransferase involved in cell wall biosynthesis
VYYGLATALALPSVRGETWGLVVNEAMASGLPVLVSRQCGCAATLVEAGGNGWVFDAEQTGEIASALQRLEGCDWLRMGTRSREIIAGWGLERFYEGVREAAECVLKFPPKPAGLLDRLLLRSWNGRYRPT